MWQFLNDSFLSIVAHRDKPEALLVRARKAGDIEAVFPDAHVREGEGTDYRFRADIERERVAETLAARARATDYGNFKNSVRDHARHDAYFEVWDVMQRWGKEAGKSAEAIKKQSVMR